MSSILDALKKLEEEKAEAARATTVEFEDDSVEHDLIRGGKRHSMTIQFSPSIVVAVVAIALVAVLGGVYAMKSRETSGSALARSAVSTLPAPAAVSPAVPAKVETVAAPVPAAVAPTPTPPVTPAASAPLPVAASVPVPTPVPSTPGPNASIAKAIPVPARPVVAELAPPQPVEATPALAPQPVRPVKTPVVAETEPKTAEAPARSRTASAPQLAKNTNSRLAAKDGASGERPAPVKDDQPTAAPAVKTTPSTDTLDIYSLPILTESDKSRLGLKGMEVNMLRSPNKNRPSPSAIINMQPVYVNEVIEGTKAKLIGVDVRGIAIEIGGERFFVRR